MSTSRPAIQTLSRQLLAGRARAKSSNGDPEQVVRECEKLRGPLIQLAGVNGFSTLFSRALVLAQRQTPWLAKLDVGVDGSLTGFSEIQQKLDAETARQAGAVLVAEMLSLLITLIGEPLTFTLVREAWPEASPENITLATKEKS